MKATVQLQIGNAFKGLVVTSESKELLEAVYNTAMKQYPQLIETVQEDNRKVAERQSPDKIHMVLDYSLGFAIETSNLDESFEWVNERLHFMGCQIKQDPDNFYKETATYLTEQSGVI